MTTLSPVAGVTRLRALQLGLETTPLTQHAATRRYPWSATPTINPNWTKSTADTGTLDNAIAPYPKALDIGVQTVGELFANDAPTLISAGVMGGLSLTTSSTAKILTAAPASTSQDVFDTYTAEVFDDATADAWALTGGVINRWQLDYPQDQGPIISTADWLFAGIVYPATPTGALTVDTSPVPLFGGDTYFYLNDTSGAIGTTQLVSQIYGASLVLNNNLDPKRFSNGSNSMRKIQNYGRGERVLDFTWTFAKATAAIAEAAKWIAVSPTERYASISTQSSVAAAVGIPNSLTWNIPGHWFTRADVVINTNTGFSLSGQQIVDAGLGYPFQVVSKSTRATLT
jgi:hypothetical protein